MTSTRELVLQTLLTQHRCTIQVLAQAVGINDISVRHHINSLQAEGLVDSEEERHGVGRPHRVYFLTEAGTEQFPTRYLRLTLLLLEQIKETMPAKMVDRLFRQMAKDLAENYIPQNHIKDMTTEERLDFIKEILAQEGFNIEWERHENEYHIHEIACPYYHIGQEHPEVCMLGKALISTVLDVPMKKTHSILHGDNVCTYVISPQHEEST